MRWDIENNVVSKLYNNMNENIIEPWGFETADSNSFFSLETGFGHRYKIKNKEVSFCKNTYGATLDVEMREGHWELKIRDAIEGNYINRKVEALVVEDSYFMDFVLRYRFKKDYILSAIISGKEIYHRNSNIYYQYDVNEVKLNTASGIVKLSIIDSIVPQGMKPVIYVRDAKGEWVVHVRMVPDNPDKEVIKICTSWAGTRPIPTMLTKLLLSSTLIRKSLWYRAEIKPYKNKLYRYLFNPSAFGMKYVKKGERLKWDVRLAFDEE